LERFIDDSLVFFKRSEALQTLNYQFELGSKPFTGMLPKLKGHLEIARRPWVSTETKNREKLVV
jgi:hypothetical protein